MSRQNPLTVITPIRPDKLEELREILDYMKYTLENILGFDERSKFKDLYEEVHYLRWIIIDDKESEFFKHKKNADSLKPKLVFSSNFDKSVDHHLDDLSTDKLASIQKMDGMAVYSDGHTLTDQIYSCCIGYPESSNRTLKTRKDYLRDHIVKVSAFYRGSPRRSVSQIKEENELRVRLRKELDDNKDKWKDLSAKEIHRKLKLLISNDHNITITDTKYRMPKNSVFKLCLLVFVIVLLLPVIIIWLFIVQFGHEKYDKYFTTYRSDIPRKQTEILEEYEDLTDGERPQPVQGFAVEEARAQPKKDMIINYQNQFSQLVDMKPGKVRLITFKAMMLFARVIIPIWYVEGKLLNIPTIHFARWVLFDDNKRVLFFSNFDGSWQQYLGDFIDQSGWGLSAIFSNTTVFPKTNWLGSTGFLSMKNIIPKSKMFFPGGAYDEEHFLAWSRSTELPTNIWYSAYPDLSIKNVNNNSRIRVMLAKNLSEKKARQFFELI